jgi:SAM-dependent methyltransferase
MLARARQLSLREGLRNVSFVQADAQIHRFPPERFDLAISRFGTMFFADPVIAFTNIGGALRTGARLVQLVWQDSGRQEWSAVIRAAFAGEQPPPAPAADPFSLADPATAGAILTASGFTDVTVTGLHEPVYYGPDTATALDAVLTLQMTKDLLAPLDTARTEHALSQLGAALAAHESRSGVLFDSHAWLITARRL